MKNYNPIDYAQQVSTPSTPPTGYSKIYPKSDGKWYALDSSGVEKEVVIGTSVAVWG